MPDDDVLDLPRLRRAVHLDVRQVARDEWVVTGGTEPHRVIQIGDRLECDCPDRGIRRARCKHLIAVALHRGNRTVLRSLRRLVSSTTRPPAA